MATGSGAARLLRSALSGPGAASHPYAGSRKLAQRFEYSEHSSAGFVELAPSSFGAGQRIPDDLGSALQQGPGAGEGPGSASSRRRLRPGQSLRNCWRGLLGTTCRKEMAPGPFSKQLELPGVLTMEENVGPGSARSRCEVAWASEDITLCGVCAGKTGGATFDQNWISRQNSCEPGGTANTPN